MFFFRKLFIKDSKESLFNFLKFYNRMDVKKSQRFPSFTVSGMVTWSGTLYPIFVVLEGRCFFYATLKMCFTEAPPQFLPETKRFARVKDYSRFSALCDLPKTIKNIFEKFRFFFQFSVFKGFSLRKMGFLLFSVGEVLFSRLMRILSGIFWRCIL